jgi:hypothetical protein
MDIATVEPASFTAGDTVKWKRSLADYPATGGWTLKYRLISAANKYDITASASGADHLVTVTAATSATYVAGEYAWQAYVEGGSSERYTVGTGTLTIAPNLAGQSGGLETRSTARQIVAELEAARLAYATNGQGHVQRFTIGNREMWFRSSADFLREIEYFRNQVANEEAAEAIAKGLGNPRRLYVRFQ